MKVVIKYKSDRTGKMVTEEVFIEHLPQPRIGDTVFAEGRPRQVSRRNFHLLGQEESGPWWTGVEGDDEPFVEIKLIG